MAAETKPVERVLAQLDNAIFLLATVIGETTNGCNQLTAARRAVVGLVKACDARDAADDALADAVEKYGEGSDCAEMLEARRERDKAMLGYVAALHAVKGGA